MMKLVGWLATVAPLAMAAPAAAAPVQSKGATAAKGDKAPAKEDVITTGVAKGRDRLDSATSTSVLREAEIEKLGARSIGEILRDVPGIRSEVEGGEAGSNISIRGLPIATAGAKFVQLQEDGLPVLEFGDILDRGADSFIRADLNLAQVEVIRGGSASTFASNSPGGIINFISKTGDVEGGAVALTAGVDYDQYRADIDYGAHLSDTLRFHVGGFFRQGEGPRKTGFDAQKGGQVKLNITKTFTGGYIRLYGKYLDDRTPYYDTVPLRVTGTDGNPTYSEVPGFDATDGSSLTRYNPSNRFVDRNGAIATNKLTDGRHSKVKAIGVEAQADLGSWTVTEKFRYARIWHSITNPFNVVYLPAPAVLGGFGAGPGTGVAYATGPQAGQAITDVNALNGNGLLALATILNSNTRALDNVTNDVRASRVWTLGAGDLTTTLGFYASRQTIDTDLAFTTAISEVRGGGDAALVDLFDPTGRAITQNGYFSYNFALTGGMGRRVYDVRYDTNAPFASANYHIGRVSIGASVRYDYGKAQGQIFSSDLRGGRVGNVPTDINGDGVISSAETRVSVIPTPPAPVDYTFHSLSYSTGVNFRIAEPLAVFARYSRGGRTTGDRLLFTPIVSPVTGDFTIPSAKVDPVRQAEVGLKYRHQALTLNVTGFWAKVVDSNFETQLGLTTISDYTAKGVEFEGGIRHGIFSLNGGATYTDAEISGNAAIPEIVGNTPRHQAKFIFQATPQVTFDRFNVGAVFIGTTDSYAQNVNLLKMPGYVTTNAFVQLRPIERLLLSLNASNLFDVKALVSVNDATIPPTGIVGARLLNGRTISLTARFDF